MDDHSRQLIQGKFITSPIHPAHAPVIETPSLFFPKFALMHENFLNTDTRKVEHCIERIGITDSLKVEYLGLTLRGRMP